MADDTSAASVGRHRPKNTTVFVAAFVAGAVAAVVVNRALDLHLAQSKPQVESEPIFVALRAMPQGSPVTVWDVALRDWPRAMLPTSALRAGDTFEGSVLKYPVREGQPLLAIQLMPAQQPAAVPPAAVEEAFVLPPQPAPQKQVAAVRPTSQPAEPPKPQEAEVVSTPTLQAEESTVVSIDTATVDAAAAQPEPTPPAARNPSDLETTEQTSGTPTASTAPDSQMPTPAPTEPTEPTPTRIASDVEPLIEPPSRPAVDLEKIPSVMARSDEPAEPAEASAPSGPVRYLVVPERIARQADTSFVPPPAVEPEPETTPTPSPKQPVAPTPTRSAQASTPPVKGIPQRSGTSPSPSRKPTQPQVLGQPQPRKQQSQSLKQQRPQPQQRSPAPSRERPETASKPREPMFPILAAGIEAMGNRWRSDADEAEATDQPSAQRRK